MLICQKTYKGVGAHLVTQSGQGSAQSTKFREDSKHKGHQRVKLITSKPSIMQKEDLIRKKKLMELEQRENNLRRKHDMKSKLHEVKKEIEEERIQDRNKIREQSQNIAEKIHQNKEKELNDKKEKRNRVLQIQNESKENYKMFFAQKKDYIAKAN